MDEIEKAAFLCVGRACAFAWLAAICLMFAFSFQPPLAAFIGGVVALGATAALLVAAKRAPSRPYKRTELWGVLSIDQRPPPAGAQQVSGRVLREKHLYFAQLAAKYAVFFFALGLVLRLIGFNELPGMERY